MGWVSLFLQGLADLAEAKKTQQEEETTGRWETPNSALDLYRKMEVLKWDPRSSAAIDCYFRRRRSRESYRVWGSGSTRRSNEAPPFFPSREFLTPFLKHPNPVPPQTIPKVKSDAVAGGSMRPGTLSVGECSSSTSLSSHQDIDDDRMIAVALTEEYAKLDGGVARRLSNLAPIAHTPRVNLYIPTQSDASLEYHRLLQRLNVYGLHEVKVSGDGNCQFRALSDQLYKSPEYHKHVRKDIVKQLKDYRSQYEGYVPMKFSRYYKKMAKSGEWGDHVTLQAAADKFAAKICLLTSFRDTCFIEIVPQSQTPKRELWLSFWSEVHYNSLYEIQDVPVQQKPGKKHWLF
ncbi:OVARIAN TUMOR DOMAIN-containing deubiquitinating enzyme 12, partial [Cucurbita argyrosperma subsp. sororia]